MASSSWLVHALQQPASSAPDGEQEATQRNRVVVWCPVRSQTHAPRPEPLHVAISRRRNAQQLADMRLRSSRVSNPTAAIDVLPPALLRAIFLALPADQRARAACVCRGWRAFLADPALWLRLDLSEDSGVTCRLDDAALRAAAARAQGRLEVLNIRNEGARYTVSHAALCVVAAANATTLRKLCGVLSYMFDLNDKLAELRELLAAAPALEALGAHVECECNVKTRQLLRNDPPFGPLRMYRLVCVRGVSGPDFRAMTAELSSHRSLTELCVFCTDEDSPLLTDELELVVDAALAVSLKKLELSDCGLTPAAAPALARLLTSPALTCLHLENSSNFETLLDAPGYALLGNALRSNRTLRELALANIVWYDAAAEVPALFEALIGHASLRSFVCAETYLGAPLAGNDVEPLAGAELEAATAIFGHAFGRLVAADAPALEELRISFDHPSADALGPLFDALPRNTHLHVLRFQRGNVSAAFVEQRLLPALRANTSLRKLAYSRSYPDFADARLDAAIAEAVQLVDLREVARVAAEAAGAGQV